MEYNIKDKFICKQTHYFINTDRNSYLLATVGDSITIIGTNSRMSKYKLYQIENNNKNIKYTLKLNEINDFYELVHNRRKRIINEL